MKQNTKMKTKVFTRTGVLKSKGPALNEEGFDGFARKPKTELFLLGVGRFYDESSFYEAGSNRFVDLIHKVTKSDPEWVANFLKWLRHDANIRTSAIVGAAEYVKAGGPNGRTVVKSVINRADEPAEMLAYWLSKYGKTLPQPIKRGIRDSAQTFYSERNFARWDSKGATVRMADVVELTHPKPSGTHQSHLFQYMLEDRHGRGSFEGKWINNLIDRAKCRTREDYINQLQAGNRTISWENVSSAGIGPMSAEEWESVVPYMGYMAILRNLRNLDRAGLDKKVKSQIGAGLADLSNVESSKQLPIRFYSAYNNVQDDLWKSYLSQALTHSLKNVPVLKGKWLILVDASGSMFYGNYGKSDITPYQTACVFGAALAVRNNADLRTYSNILSPVLNTVDVDVLKTVEVLGTNKYAFGMGTQTGTCLGEAFNQGKYDGVVLLTDEQHNDYWGNSPSQSIPQSIPLYTFNLSGYKVGNEIAPNRITVGGLSDSGFEMINAIENSKEKWPWE